MRALIDYLFYGLVALAKSNCSFSIGISYFDFSLRYKLRTVLQLLKKHWSLEKKVVLFSLDSVSLRKV